jgi:hypothetical protein
MVRCMQNTPPEHPDALAPNIKERHHFQPPGLISSRHTFQPRFAELLMPAPKCIRREFRRQQGRWFRFACKPNEFGKKIGVPREAGAS